MWFQMPSCLGKVSQQPASTNTCWPPTTRLAAPDCKCISHSYPQRLQLLFPTGSHSYGGQPRGARVTTRAAACHPGIRYQVPATCLHTSFRSFRSFGLSSCHSMRWYVHAHSLQGQRCKAFAAFTHSKTDRNHGSGDYVWHRRALVACQMPLSAIT